MTLQEYKQKKRECFVKFCKDNGIDQEVNISIFDAFDQIFDRAYALGKQEKDAEDTVIQGWVCRDKKDNVLYLHAEKPYRAQGGYDECDDLDWWENDCGSYLPLGKSVFPNLTWESDPIEVEIIIKRKKNE